MKNTFALSAPNRRTFVAGLAAAGLIAPLGLRAQTAPAKVIRLGSPDLGTAGKSSPGASTLAIVQANRWLEEEFAKDGIEVQWNFFRGAGPAVAEALAAKQLDIVYLGDLASVIHKSHGLPTRYLLPTGRGSNSYLATAPGSTIRTVADLKGKRVSVLKGTAYQRPFDSLLATARLTEKDVRLINMDWPSSKAAVVAGQIDATFGGPDLFTLRDKGVHIPLSTRGRGPGFEINAGALATEDFATNQAPLVQRVVRQLVRASHWASQDSNREALIKLYASNSGNPEVAFREELAGENLAQRYSPLIDDGLIAAYQGVHDDGLKLGLIRQSYDVKAWFEPKFLRQALRDLKLENAWKEADATGKLKGAA
ncbi:MAG: ABC transporter substrate-binding protein [Hydrogenophaga sp.]|uniref:ABC transporter substrate-binding protein n=1 Tax=Hydrogenophaga sp. TaxID=1904254 RepID=UPI002731048E|nr:ABC transporter substrate-binding protein [Hydrogenophaga sp.]MDP2162695.1 ABC transporter substrate-binding protein [Hydrogenophaga sp.]MDP3477007.1 ABC transporter substrate-binding protein [Hydrogenophaga sp.]